MKFVIFSVKILETTDPTFSEDGTSRTELLVQLPEEKLMRVNTWGKLSHDVAQQYYQPGDYIIIEGYISHIPFNKDDTSIKELEISVSKI